MTPSRLRWWLGATHSRWDGGSSGVLPMRRAPGGRCIGGFDGEESGCQKRHLKIMNSYEFIRLHPCQRCHHSLDEFCLRWFWSTKDSICQYLIPWFHPCFEEPLPPEEVPQLPSRPREGQQLSSFPLKPLSRLDKNASGHEMYELFLKRYLELCHFPSVGVKPTCYTLGMKDSSLTRQRWTCNLAAQELGGTLWCYPKP